MHYPKPDSADNTPPSSSRSSIALPSQITQDLFQDSQSRSCRDLPGTSFPRQYWFTTITSDLAEPKIFRWARIVHIPTAMTKACVQKKTSINTTRRANSPRYIRSRIGSVTDAFETMGYSLR